MHDWPLKLIAYRLANVRYSDLHRSVHQGEHEHRRDHTFGVHGGVERGGGRSHAQGDGVAFVYQEAPRLDRVPGAWHTMSYVRTVVVGVAGVVAVTVVGVVDGSLGICKAESGKKIERKN